MKIQVIKLYKRTEGQKWIQLLWFMLCETLSNEWTCSSNHAVLNCRLVFLLGLKCSCVLIGK